MSALLVVKKNRMEKNNMVINTLKFVLRKLALSFSIDSEKGAFPEGIQTKIEPTHKATINNAINNPDCM